MANNDILFDAATATEEIKWKLHALVCTLLRVAEDISQDSGETSTYFMATTAMHVADYLETDVGALSDRLYSERYGRMVDRKEAKR